MLLRYSVHSDQVPRLNLGWAIYRQERSIVKVGLSIKGRVVHSHN